MSDITCPTCGLEHEEDDVFSYDETDFSDVPLLFPQVVLELPCGHEMAVEETDETEAESRAFLMRVQQVIEKEKWFNDQGV